MYKDFDDINTCVNDDSNSRCRRMENITKINNTCISEEIKRKTWGLDGYPLASVYAPIQNFDELYDEETALSRGTVFAELDLPFMGESVYKGGNCRG